MPVKIAHLYYDLLNLYGEQGNILALKNAFARQKVTVKIDLVTINSKINFKKYDLIYLGSGSKDNLLLALEDLKQYKKSLQAVIEKGTYIIATGNAHEMFGRFIEIDRNKYPALGIFNYYAKQNFPKRIVGESLMKFPGLEPIIGFQNRTCVIHNEENHLFTVLEGYADNFKSIYEGYHKNNFIGTYLIGPLLIRNPHFTDGIVKDILTHKKIAYHEIKDTYEYQAYAEYRKNFYEK